MKSAHAESPRRVIVWIRRELRVHDHLALWTAARDAREIVPLFIMDDDFRSSSPAKKRIVVEALHVLRASLRKLGGDLFIRRGEPFEVILRLIRTLDAAGVYVTKEYHPAARSRDEKIRSSVEGAGKLWKEFKDHVLFDDQEILNAAGTGPLVVFTAYKNAWRKKAADIAPVIPSLRSLRVPDETPGELPSLQGKETRTPKGLHGGESSALRLIHDFLPERARLYRKNRDLLGIEGTSRLSHHLSTGTIGTRTLYHEVYEASRSARGAQKIGVETFLDQLIWREFYYQILSNFPHVVTGSFRQAYDRLEWSHNHDHFSAWADGRTGYPVVDASMRQLNTEGWMHNRGRMIVASFLTKDLHQDWRMGERYFMEKLADGDVALNNGGWQWCAGTGNDAQPWFRIFNPLLQSRRFDPQGIFIRKYVPELANVPEKFIHEPSRMPAALQEKVGCRIGKEYPAPIVNHDAERQQAINIYRSIK